MQVSTLKATRDGGVITVGISLPTSPHSAAAVIWRFSADGKREAEVGELTSLVPPVPIGDAVTNNSKKFYVRGKVLNENDNPPVPFQLLVTVGQGGKALLIEAPTEKEDSRIGSKDVRFIYRFVVEVAS